MQEIKTRRPLFEAGLAYSLAALIPILFSAALSVLLIVRPAFAETDGYIYLSYALPQIALAASAACFFARSKVPVRETGGKPSWYFFPLAVLLSFGLLSLSEVNGLFIGVFQKMGYVPSDVPVPELSGWNLLPALLLIAVTPALFEETLFRGIGVQTMRREGWGTGAIVLVSGALFSLFHGNPVQTVYQFLCGCAYALLAVRSKSVYPTMLAHFLNNGCVLVLAACGIDGIPAGAKLPVYLAAGAVLVCVLAFLLFFRGERGGEKKPAFRISGGKQYFWGAAAGIAICAIEWLAVLAMGFMA